MCGILGIIGQTELSEALKLSKLQVHRGGDQSGYHQTANGSILVHERLSFLDLENGKQPLFGKENAVMVHNGQIYNYKTLKESHLKEVEFQTETDSEVIVHLYEKFGPSFIHLLDGVFVFIILDGDKFMVGRDPIGIKPLYYGKDATGKLYFSSELKVIHQKCIEVATFPPGHYMTEDEVLVKYFKPQWESSKEAVKQLDYSEIKSKLIEVTRKRMNTKVPMGVLLSGGLDSSLTSAIAAKIKKEAGEDLHSFSIGLTPDAPDLVAARSVAEHIGTIHHEVLFTVEEGISILEKLIWHLETYDVTSIRASTPMYFLSKHIKQQGIKMVLSGEGADEVFGGYLYFKNAPSLIDFQKETIDRVFKLSTADCLRADKSTMAHGVEARVPFLDLDFLNHVMLLDPKYKMPNPLNDSMEKYILRRAFDDETSPMLPSSILWRQKEQFSDGVGYSWIDQLKEHCEKSITDEEMLMAKSLFPINTPETKEAMYYRKIFSKLFPGKSTALTVKRWTPKWQEDKDPSGRANVSHSRSYVLNP